MAVLQASEVSQERGDDPHANFLMLTASGVSTVRSRTRDLGLSRKPDTSGRDSYSPVLLGH